MSEVGALLRKPIECEVECLICPHLHYGVHFRIEERQTRPQPGSWPAVADLWQVRRGTKMSL